MAHFWCAAPVQSKTTSPVPGSDRPPTVLRHLFDRGLRQVPSPRICHCWAPVRLHWYRITGVPLASAPANTSRHRSDTRTVPSPGADQRWLLRSAHTASSGRSRSAARHRPPIPTTAPRWAAAAVGGADAVGVGTGRVDAEVPVLVALVDGFGD